MRIELNKKADARIVFRRTAKSLQTIKWHEPNKTLKCLNYIVERRYEQLATSIAKLRDNLRDNLCDNGNISNVLFNQRAMLFRN